MDAFIQGISEQLAKSVPNLLGAVAILILGWLFAIIVSWIVKSVLSSTSLDNRLAAWMTGNSKAEPIANLEQWAASAVFWMIMLFVLVAFLQALQLQAVSEPLGKLLSEVFAYLPKVGGAAILLGVAWLLATLCRLLLVRGLQSFSLDDRLNAQVSGEGTDGQPSVVLSETLGNALYWFIFLLFLPAILDALNLQGPLQPVQSLVNDILAILPNVFAAIIIGAAGWFLARIVRMIVTNLLSAAGADQVGARFGLSAATGGQGLSTLAGTVVYVLMLIPVAIAAFNALEIRAISGPAIEMLSEILSAIPKIFTAAVILVVAYVLGKIVGDLVTNLLTGIGFNNVFLWLGLQATQEPADTLPTAESDTSTATANRKTPSEVAGMVVLVAIILVFLIPATDVLQFQPLTLVITELLRILGQVLVGVLVFAVGLYLANLAFNILSSSGGSQARLVAQAARVAIIALVAAMALQQMGIATSIVNLAFGLLFGAVAVAMAVAFGFGSMDIAGEQVRKWLNEFQAKD